MATGGCWELLGAAGCYWRGLWKILVATRELLGGHWGLLRATGGAGGSYSRGLVGATCGATGSCWGAARSSLGESLGFVLSSARELLESSSPLSCTLDIGL